jgi:hypothetical protein
VAFELNPVSALSLAPKPPQYSVMSIAQNRLALWITASVPWNKIQPDFLFFPIMHHATMLWLTPITFTSNIGLHSGTPTLRGFIPNLKWKDDIWNAYNWRLKSLDTIFYIS